MLARRDGNALPKIDAAWQCDVTRFALHQLRATTRESRAGMTRPGYNAANAAGCYPQHYPLQLECQLDSQHQTEYRSAIDGEFQCRLVLRADRMLDQRHENDLLGIMHVGVGGIAEFAAVQPGCRHDIIEADNQRFAQGFRRFVHHRLQRRFHDSAKPILTLDRLGQSCGDMKASER